jgi:two-component system, NtrC family, sensor histidine kinase KinB
MDIRRPIRASILAKLTIFAALFSLVPLYLLTTFFILIHKEFLWYGLSALFVLTLLLLGGAYVLARHITRPILALKRGVERIARGDFSTVVEVSSHDELQDLAAAFNIMSEDLHQYHEVRLDELLIEKTKTEGIIYTSEDGIILTDENGHVQLINPKAMTLLELEEDKEALTGRPIWSFVKHDQLAIAIRDSVEGDSPKIIREVNLSAEGVRRYYSISVSLINAPEGSGTNYWFVVQIRNITAEKELDQLKDDFLQSLTHDLRSPMTAVRGYLQVLGEEMAGPLNDDQKKMIRIMENASTKLLHIVSNLLDSAKMSAGKLKLNIAECNLRQVVPNTVEIFHTEAAKKKITLTLDMPDQMSPMSLDPQLLERVIINLIGNSIKFTPDGGFITVKFIELSDRIQGQVTDTGNGMPPEFLDRIFKKFEQASGTRGGTGLGLSICKFVVDAHYGEISVRSKQGEGTTFSFWIPKGLQQNERGDVFRVRSSNSAAA